jgi:hypothetical protein
MFFFGGERIAKFWKKFDFFLSHFYLDFGDFGEREEEGDIFKNQLFNFLDMF